MEESAGSAGEATAESDRGLQKPEEPAGEREHYQQPVRDQRCQHHLETTCEHTDTQTHTQYHSTVKHNNYLTWEPINASIAVWKHTHTCTHHADTTVTSTCTTGCPYVDIWKTQKHTSHEWDIKEKKMSTSHTRPTLSYASHTCLSASFLSIPTRTGIIDLNMRNITAWGDTHAHTRNQPRTSFITVIPELALFLSGRSEPPPSINQQTLAYCQTLKRNE